MLISLLLSCNNSVLALDEYTVLLDQETHALTVDHAEHGVVLRNLQVLAGTGTATVEFKVGSFKFDALSQSTAPLDLGKPQERDGMWVIPLDREGDALGELRLMKTDGRLHLSAEALGGNRIGFSAECIENEAMLGLGSHAFDVDHYGEAFALWVSEPGIGKSDQDVYPDDWFLTGTRHSTSFPVPFLLRPQAKSGLFLDASERVEVDLCKTDPERFSMVAWSEESAELYLHPGDPLPAIESFVQQQGGYTLPQPWVFAPWVDAVRGVERVMQVAQDLRAVGASGTVIWTEDWKGAEMGSFGYRLTGEWFVDETLYPDVEDVAQDLEDLGFKWFAYFSPFLYADTQTWDEAEALGIIIQDADGEIVTFTGPTFKTMTMVDISNPKGQEFALDHMNTALDLGFDGWMADYAEWLPVEAQVYSGSGWTEHNTWPVIWQELNAQAMEGRDGSYFVRSGWAGSASVSPVVWAGDQRTSFDPDDGFPTILPLGLGLSLSGQPVYTHDIAGYQSIGNAPSDFELWARWAALGAFSPVMRTHHGSFADENHQFDQDEQTLALWAELTQVHTRLFPYRYGLANQAAERGTPMILPTALLFEGEDFGRTDVWMLGSGLLVAPVLERGATTVQVQLPDAVRWLDYWTLTPAESGTYQAALGEIPVFIAEGTLLPRFETAPDTLTGQATDDLTDLADVDGVRTLLIFGEGGSFAEADGTTYTLSSGGETAGQATEILSSGSVQVGSATVEIQGSIERTYKLEYIP